MSQMTEFRFEGLSVRTFMIEGDPWFVGKDLCASLSLANHRQTLSSLDTDERGVITADSPSGQQEYVIVSEAGLYSLIMRSRKPEAKRFKRWVTHEVLPQIRKVGGYQVHGGELVQQWGLPGNYTEALEAHLRDTWEIERLNRDLAEAQRPAAFARQFLSAGGSMSMSDVAKALHGLDIPIAISPNKIWLYLEEQGWVFRHAKDQKWRATQKFLDKGHLIHRPGTSYENRNGDRFISAPQVRCTAKGFYALIELLDPPNFISESSPLQPSGPTTASNVRSITS